MANSFIDRLFPQQSQFGSPNIMEGTAFDHWKGRGTSATDWKPKLSETPHGTPAVECEPHILPSSATLKSPNEAPVTGPNGNLESISFAKDDSKFSGDADAVVVATIKETISNLKSCISAEKYDDALQCIWILRNLVCGYADFKCGVICALKDSKK